MVAVMRYYSLLPQKLKEEEDFYFEERHNIRPKP